MTGTIWVWWLDPFLTTSLLVSGVAYVSAFRRVMRERGTRAFPRHRAAAFLTGLAVLFLALHWPLDEYAARWFSAHMVQHLLITLVAAPLLLLGTPVTLALLASSARTRRRILMPVVGSTAGRWLTNPIVVWSVFLLVIWGSHFTSLYAAALRNEGVHALEHAAYLAAAVPFWRPVIGLDPGPGRISHPARILYLFLAMAQMALLGFAIYGANTVLYPAYAHVAGANSASALADQRIAGAIMWTGGMFLIVPALAFVMMDWMRREERAGERADARADRAFARGTGADDGSTL